MADVLSIKRRKTADSDTSFESLRSEAVKLLEQVSGKVWTDYNLHDPGITVLEQLLYAITDLVYRTEFPLQDYLTDEQGVIDFERQALHPPVEAFPCRPTTPTDYRKVFLDGVAELDNVWITAADAEDGDGYCQGLYTIVVKPEHGLDSASRRATLEKVRALYNRTRNLCEDVAEIVVVEDLDYVLCADVEVTSARRPVDILAEIYFECARRLAGGVSTADYDTAATQAGALDQLFSGPLTRHGMIRDRDLGDKAREFLVSTLFHAINSIDGVDHVQQVYLQRDNERYYDAITSDGMRQAFGLVIPQVPDEIKVVLSINGRVLAVPIDELRARYEEMLFRYRSSRSTLQFTASALDLPQGVPRAVGRYTTIQHQFPEVYGISHFGLPESAPTELKAKARQLKAYLVIFEQLLANYQANLQNVDALFSLDTGRRSTYASNLLDKRQISDLDLIYPADASGVLTRILDKYDDYHGRKNRVLDYMLALYGERFEPHPLRHFNDYYSREAVEDVIIKNKIDYLKSIIELSRDRAAAPDYSAHSWHKRAESGLQRRVGMLLGFEQRAARALTMAILKQGIRLTRHSVYEELKAGSHEFRFVDMENIDKPSRDSFEPVPARALDPDIPLEALRTQIGDAVPLKNHVLSDMLLRGGIYLDRYRLGSLTAGQDYQLTFVTADAQYWYLGTYADKEHAIQAANALRHFLIMLNRESEGLHIVEHILLRPRARDGGPVMHSAEHSDFYPFRFSVLFPAWTARCHDSHFRMLAEETLRSNTPAHLYPAIYWLEFHKMYEFELLYEKWLAMKSDKDTEPAALDAQAQKLAEFLIHHHDRDAHGD